MYKHLTIKIETIGKGEDISYKACIKELNNSLILAENLTDLFEAVQSTIEAFDEFIVHLPKKSQVSLT